MVYRKLVADEKHCVPSLLHKLTEFFGRVRHHHAILDAFKTAHSSTKRTEQIGDGAPYTIIDNVNFNDVKSEILDKFCFVNGESFNHSVIEKLSVILKRKGLNPNVEVIWMRDKDGEFSNHTIDEFGHIPNYSVGRRPKDLSKKATYEGDDYHFRKDDIIQLQIHNIRDKITRISSPTLAFYIPKNVIEYLTNLVIQSN